MKTKELKKEIREKKVDALYKELTSDREKLATLRKDLAFGKLKSPREIRKLKYKISVTKTVILEKTIAELEKNEKAK